MVSSSEFSAHAFHASLPRGQASASLLIGAGQIVFTVADQRVTLPLKGLLLKLGGAANRLLFVSHPHFPEWQFYTSELQILEHPTLQPHPGAVAVRKARKRHAFAFWGSLVAVLAFVVSILFLAYWSLDGLSAMAARRIPISWEQKLGESVLAQYRLQHEFLDDKRAQVLLQPLTEPLLKALGNTRYPMHFYLVDDSAINAFALPGGYMVINSGLVLNAQRAEAVQGVIAHEISHVTEQHGVRSVIRGTGLFVLVQTLVGDASGLLAVLANAGPTLLNQTYSRDFEREADAKAYALLSRARVNPQGMVDFFRVILAEEKKQIAKIEDPKTRELLEKTKGLLSTHPETEARIAEIEQRLKKEPQAGWREDQVAFLALKRAVQEFVSEKEGSGKK